MTLSSTYTIPSSMLPTPSGEAGASPTPVFEGGAGMNNKIVDTGYLFVLVFIPFVLFY
jgi:hypothetical protein